MSSAPEGSVRSAASSYNPRSPQYEVPGSRESPNAQSVMSGGANDGIPEPAYNPVIETKVEGEVKEEHE